MKYIHDYDTPVWIGLALVAFLMLAANVYAFPPIPNEK